MSYATGDGTANATVAETPDRPLAGRALIVTGAGSGIGRATAQLIADAGGHAVCVDVKASAETAESIVSAGGTADAYELDVREASGWERTVEAVLTSHGKVDGLCNIAGVVARGVDNVVDVSPEDWDRVINTNLKGYWLGMRAVFPSMIENGGGRIVNVASLAGVVGMPNVFAYSAAKGGVIGMSRQASIEYAGTGIQINTICPGIIETPILGEISDQLRQVCEVNTPVGRLGRPEDIGRLAVFLLGAGGDFVTGQVFNVDGGWSAH